jgi:hypothetical protein
MYAPSAASSKSTFASHDFGLIATVLIKDIVTVTLRDPAFNVYFLSQVNLRACLLLIRSIE